METAGRVRSVEAFSKELAFVLELAPVSVFHNIGDTYEAR
jgi:hypothetical protein